MMSPELLYYARCSPYFGDLYRQYETPDSLPEDVYDELSQVSNAYWNTQAEMHPLDNTWRLYRAHKQEHYWAYQSIAAARLVGELTDMCHYPICQLPKQHDYAFFRDDVPPKCEAKENRGGGYWQYVVPLPANWWEDGEQRGDWEFHPKICPEYDLVQQRITNVFKVMMLTVVTTCGEFAKQVVGVYFNMRPGYFRVRVWTRRKEKKPLMDIGAYMSDRIADVLGDQPQLKFFPHDLTLGDVESGGVAVGTKRRQLFRIPMGHS